MAFSGSHRSWAGSGGTSRSQSVPGLLNAGTWPFTESCLQTAPRWLLSTPTCHPPPWVPSQDFNSSWVVLALLLLLSPYPAPPQPLQLTTDTEAPSFSPVPLLCSQMCANTTDSTGLIPAHRFLPWAFQKHRSVTNPPGGKAIIVASLVYIYNKAATFISLLIEFSLLLLT